MANCRSPSSNNLKSAHIVVSRNITFPRMNLLQVKKYKLPAGKHSVSMISIRFMVVMYILHTKGMSANVCVARLIAFALVSIFLQLF